jgi:hypothetical protein
MAFDNANSFDEQVLDQHQLDYEQEQLRISSLARELHAYLSYLASSSTVAKVNARLDRECNTTEKATELVDYYRRRPQLAAYTIRTELPRMDYQLTDRDGTQFKSSSGNFDDSLASRMLHASAQPNNDSILIRCANQSLLADLLVFLSTPDQDNGHAIVRQDYWATCVADQVCVHVKLPEMVQIKACLEIIAPSATLEIRGDHKPGSARQVVAHLHVTAALGMPSLENQPQVVEYRLTRIELMDDWESLILRWAAYLVLANEQPLEDVYHAHENTNFRDVFVQRSQILLHSSAVLGMQSAWGELQVATGLDKMMLPALPALLSHQVLQQALDDEQRLLLEEMQHQSISKHRPTSILGGLVQKGWTQLANSVSLTGEDNPSSVQRTRSLKPMSTDRRGAASRLEPELRLYHIDRRIHPDNPDSFRISNQQQGCAEASLPILQLDKILDVPLPPLQREHALVDKEIFYGAIDDEGAIDTIFDTVSGEIPPRGGETVIHSGIHGHYTAINWTYDAETDIRPTRERWTNPSAGSRQLAGVKKLDL